MVEPIQEETHLPVDDGFGLTLEEEVQVLRADNDRLRRDLKTASSNQGSAVSSEQLTNLQTD